MIKGNLGRIESVLVSFLLIASAMSGLAAHSGATGAYADRPTNNAQGTATILTTPGDSTMSLRCVGVIPSTMNCLDHNLQPFETIVYDANNNGLYDSGELVIIGPRAELPAAGILLSDDPKILYLDNNGDNLWTPSREAVFYDTNGTIAGRFFFRGGSAGPSKDDSGIKFVDLNSNGKLDGVVRVIVSLSLLGGTIPDGTQEDVDGFQSVFSYDPVVLQGLPLAYGRLTNEVFSQCSNSDLHEDPANPGMLTGGGSASMPGVFFDDRGGKFYANELCVPSSAPPFTPDIGLGCDPAISGSAVDSLGNPYYFCPGADTNPRTLDSPLENLDVMSVSFIVVGRGAFKFTFDPDPPAPGSKIVDVDGFDATRSPLSLIGSADFNFDNREHDPDANGDGLVNILDFSLIASLIGTPIVSCDPPSTLCHSDVDNDLDIDSNDAYLSAAYFVSTIHPDPDTDGDGDIDISDFTNVYVNQFQPVCGAGVPAYRAHIDTDNDCDIDITDFIFVFASQFLPWPPPSGP